jgi:osmotically-inducible protein OsmY
MTMRERELALIVILALVPVLHGCFAAAAGAVGATAMIAEDRRTTGVYIEDENIELKIASAIRAKYGKDDQVRVSATSFNRYVLLTGEVPSAQIKQDAGVTALGIENVRNVQNELTIAPPIGFKQKSTDAMITTKVKSRFLTENKFQINYVKVVTNADVVYLMGLVTPKEADDATELARTTDGVVRVVRVFEVTDHP